MWAVLCHSLPHYPTQHYPTPYYPTQRRFFNDAKWDVNNVMNWVLTYKSSTVKLATDSISPLPLPPSSSSSSYSSFSPSSSYSPSLRLQSRQHASSVSLDVQRSNHHKLQRRNFNRSMSSSDVPQSVRLGNDARTVFSKVDDAIKESLNKQIHDQDDQDVAKWDTLSKCDIETAEDVFKTKRETEAPPPTRQTMVRTPSRHTRYYIPPPLYSETDAKRLEGHENLLAPPWQSAGWLLTSMGFDELRVREALLASSGSVEGAVECLVTSQLSSPPSSSSLSSLNGRTKDGLAPILHAPRATSEPEAVPAPPKVHLVPPGSSQTPPLSPSPSAGTCVCVCVRVCVCYAYSNAYSFTVRCIL
jgi:hypothetical protein